MSNLGWQVLGQHDETACCSPMVREPLGDIGQRVRGLLVELGIEAAA
ncbi:hypothetical protein [Streptomyces sp. NPDC101115]